MSRQRARHPRRRRGKPAFAPETITGTVRLDADGGGTLQPQDSDRDEVYLPPEELQRVRSGDVVTVRLEAGRKGRVRGRVVGVGATRDRIIGILKVRGSQLFVVPDPAGPAINIAPDQLGGAREGDAVEVEITDARRRASVRGVVRRILGNPADPRVQIAMAILGSGLADSFSDAALAEATAVPEVQPVRVLAAEPNRHDLREVTHVTIDGADARDFDDAVAARAEESAVRVWVSIADVATYVPEGSALDTAARERGTSVYFPHTVVPMLPERLSNDICSLKPDVPRLTVTCELLVGDDGVARTVAIYPALIRSRARLTYTKLQTWIDGLERPDNRDDLDGTLRALLGASRVLRRARRARGGIDLEILETQIDTTEGLPTGIRLRPRNEAHRLIEDLMIAANEGVAAHLEKRAWPTVYRVHEPPPPDRLVGLVRWARRLSIDVSAGDLLAPHAFARLARTLADKRQSEASHALLLRTMARACYADANHGHFGLASTGYLHFTSPIRRYPDLLVHRALHRLWRNQPPLSGLADAARLASQQERRAVVAERDVHQLMACQLALQHLGETVNAQVVGVGSMGAFIRAEGLLIEGLLPIGALADTRGEAYDYLMDEQALLGRRSGHRIALGDRLRAILTRADPRLRRVDFALAGRTLGGQRQSAAASANGRTKGAAKTGRKSRQGRRGRQR